MADLTNLKDVKIPYPTEGMIRTAQLDDPVTPVNSAQLSVNLNFDRVGAVQTREGVTEYATQLADLIKNFGTLNNFTIPAGFNRVVEIGSPDEFYPAAFIYPSSVKVDSSHVLVFWSDGTNGHAFAQVFEADDTVGGFSPIGTKLSYDTSNTANHTCIAVDSTHFMDIWASAAGIGVARIFNVDGAYNVTTAGAQFTFDAGDCADFTVSQVDASHFIIFYATTSNVGIADILAVNLSTWVISEPGATLTFESTFARSNNCAPLGDGIHFVNVWSKGLAQMFAVNTSTWGITALSTALAYDTTSQFNQILSLGDGSHFILFWEGFKGGGLHGIVEVLACNLSTFALTEPGSPLDFTSFSSGSGIFNSAVSLSDGIHFVNFWNESGTDGEVQIFTVDTGTYDVSANGNPTGFGKTANAMYNSAVALSPSRVTDVWQSNTPGGDGGLFRLDGLPVRHNLLYANFDEEVDNWDGSTWTVRRSGLQASSGKARFAQYLNRIWMVNGNASIGDPVMTSDGGDFDTTLVPDEFPPGDFIHGGFEGRVWVVDALYGVIYYTDIVQFTPPDIYTLTFDPAVNFISQIAPQSGESITGIFEVPRALLIFTENTITRIYGATSIDAYPAYNVGTYSQESIIQTKTGIFFHHSSGIYQFDYGGQPVEISRRIIDFIQAIPRSNYENITAVWDGFDAVEWAVGAVTVEGQTFTNCVLRYTISTQVWTVYDYVGNYITAMISFDDGSNLNQIMGTDVGKVGALNTGFDDFGVPFYYEYIDRWRSFTAMYAAVKSISGVNIYTENAGGTNFSYQIQGSQPNEWSRIETITEVQNSLFPNADTDDFNVIRLRLAGTTKGTQVVFHGIEILSITNKGYDSN